jgi:(p)ppGpp synthase/HD superfamily hydrolase
MVTREIIIPFADRLGLYAIRRELEDLARCYRYDR